MRPALRHAWLGLSLGLLMVWGGGCTSPVIQKVIPLEDKIRQDNATGRVLAEDFEANFLFKRDIDVEVYLRGLAQKLAAQTKELQESPVGVLLISNFQKQWWNFALPGNRIYLSVELLRGIEYENELAAALAFEFAHIVNRYVVQNLERLSERKNESIGMPILNEKFQFFGPGGVFTFSDEQHLASAELSVGILYRAGIDPRGLSALWDRYKENLSKSPYDSTTLDKLMEHTRRAIALHAPLRNPVVRSEAFLKIQKRIKRL